MGDNLKLLRVFFMLLAIFAIGRWTLSLVGVDYTTGTAVFSLVILANLSSTYYAAFGRAFGGFSWKRAAGLGLLIAFASQLVVFASTALSFALGIDSYFNAPQALNVDQAVGFGQAVGIRLVGFVTNSVTNVLTASLGWGLGALLPRPSQAAAGAVS